MSATGVWCGKARRSLWPDAGPRPASAHVLAAQQHLASCAACQQFIRDMTTIRELVGRTDGAQVQAPAQVRERLFMAIARARAGTPMRARLRVPSWLAAAAVLLVAIGGALTADRWRHSDRIDLLAVIARDHSVATGETRLASGNRAEITRWVERQAHIAIYVPTLPGARLLGARLHVRDGHYGAVVEYEINGIAVSYFVVPEPMRSSGSSQVGSFMHVRRSGYQIVSWSDGEMLHAMVANLPESRLELFARACVEQALRRNI
jgi:anti-sigma factor RsiW